MFALLVTSLALVAVKNQNKSTTCFSICAPLEVELVVQLFCLIFKIDFLCLLCL